MRIWVITFDDDADPSKMFLKEEDAGRCLAEIERGRTYDRVPRVKVLEVKE